MSADASDEALRARLAQLRNSGIRLDRDGRFWHEGETVAHAGLRAALFRWLDRLPDGRHILRLDPQRYAFLDVDDTALVATSVRWHQGHPLLGLNDGSEERLDPTTLTIDDAGVLRAAVRGGRLEARLTTTAAAALADQIDERAPALLLGGERFVIRPR